MWTGIVIVLIILLVYYWYVLRWSQWNTAYVQADSSEQYQVHREHADSKAAANLMDEITKRNRSLISYLEKKYSGENFRSFDPDKSNSIDVIGGSNMYYVNPTETDLAASLGNVSDKEDIQERLTQLIKNYKESDIREISPLNAQGYTSYTEDKTHLVLCLRKKIPVNGQYPLEDINIMMFVVIHELTHMMNKTWGHPYEFWVLFKFMLQNASEAGVYTPINYRREPLEYCGMKITYNPVFDNSLK